MRGGACVSMAWRCARSARDRSASVSACPSSADSRVMRSSAGASQSSSDASSAPSVTSGHCASGIHARRQRTRARHSIAASSQPNMPSPRVRTWSSSASRVRVASGFDSGRRSSTMASKRRSRNATTPCSASSQVTRSSLMKRVGASRSSRAASSGAARWIRASLRSNAPMRTVSTTSQGSPNRALSSCSRALRPPDRV